MPLWFGMLGWALAALWAGMFLGERGRRVDAQRREGVLPVALEEVSNPVVRRPPSPLIGDVESASELRKRLVRDCRENGYSESECEEDADRMLSQLGADKPKARG